MDLAKLADLFEGHGEVEPAGVQVLAQQGFQTGFEERDLAPGRLGDLLFIDVDGQYLMPEVRHGDGMREAEVSGPDDGNPSQLIAPPPGVLLTILAYRPGWAGKLTFILPPAGLMAPTRRRTPACYSVKQRRRPRAFGRKFTG
jgi:hypothetical protein